MALSTKKDNKRASTILQNKSTGPISKEGKVKSSKNAIVHGATSTQLLNEQEQFRYDTLITELRQAYPTTNPLIRLQLERIAKINVQLERIQNTIDAQFQRSRVLSNIYETASKSLNLDDETISAAMNSMMGFDSPKKVAPKDVMLVDRELNYIIDSKRPKTHEDFLIQAPKFCHYLHSEAVDNELSIKDFIAQKIPRISKNLPDHYPIRPDGTKIIHIFSTVASLIKLPEEFNIQFKKTELDEIKRAAEWYSMGIARFFTLSQKVRDFEKLLSIEEQATTPNLDQLDRLMRYQTALQRQLSTAIGELLALLKA